MERLLSIDDDSIDLSPESTVVKGSHFLKETEFNSRYDSNSDDENFVEIRIDEGDTLPGICLKYGLRLSEIKKLNNLYSDQDFFALNSIKLPVIKHGYLKELVKEKGLVISNSKNSALHSYFIANECENHTDEEENETLLVKSVSLMGSSESCQGEKANKFLEKMDQDLQKILNSTKCKLDTLEEVKTSLTCRRIYPLGNGKKTVNGVDCGAKWWSLVIAMFTVGLILPGFVYYFVTYIKPHR